MDEFASFNENFVLALFAVLLLMAESCRPAAVGARTAADMPNLFALMSVGSDHLIAGKARRGGGATSFGATMTGRPYRRPQERRGSPDGFGPPSLTG